MEDLGLGFRRAWVAMENKRENGFGKMKRSG